MTNWIRLTVPFLVQGPSIDDHAFAVLDELYELTDVRDPDVYVDLEESCVTLELLSYGENDLEAVKAGLNAMRTAIHAAGGHTHGWEEDFADLTDVTLFPVQDPRAEWQRTETTYARVLVDA